MKPFQHVLITRMNVEWRISRPVQERNAPEFLEHRFDIFEKTCYPSVKAQRNQNFVWFMLLDAQLPDDFRQRVEGYASNSKLIPVYIDSKDTLLETLKQAINQHLTDSTTHLITTNLDSDDAISIDFMDTVQNQFKGQSFEFINLPFGYMYRLSDQTLYLREWSTAPCHTLIEQRDNFETAITYGHADIAQYKTQQLPIKPMWLMTVHGKNVRTNYDVNASWQPLSRLTKDFQVTLDFPDKSYRQLLKETAFAVTEVITSQREWNTGMVKLKKVMNILFPWMLRSIRQLQVSLSR